MTASSNLTQGSNLPNVVAATVLLEFNGKRFAPSPSPRSKDKEALGDLGNNPFSRWLKRTFVGPIHTNPLVESFYFFSSTEEEIPHIHDDIIRMDFMK